MEITICLDKEGFRNKPQGAEIGMISSRIAASAVNISVGQLAKAIGENGQTFCPAIFSGSCRKEEDFAEIQCFPLDFDGGIDYKMIKERADHYGLPVLFSYHTFSSTAEESKFRIVFLHEIPVKDAKAARLIYAIFQELFPEADRACKDLCRMFFGGKGLIQFSDNQVFDIEKLSIALTRSYLEIDKKNAARKMKEFAEKYQVASSNSSLLIKRVYQIGMSRCDPGIRESEEKSRSNIYNEIHLEGNSSDFIITLHHSDRPGKKAHKKYNVKTMGKMGRCQLLDQFIKGEVLPHDQKFLIATNLLQTDGGKTMFFRMLDKAPDTTYESRRAWRGEYKYITDNEYKPQTCMACPYEPICKGHKANMVLSLMNRKIETIREPEYYDEEFVSEELQRQFRQAVQMRGDCIHLIKAQTAIGKTQLYCDEICNSPNPHIIALSTTRLTKEVYQRLLCKGSILPVERIPSIEDLGLPDRVANEIKHKYEVGVANTGRVLKNYMEELKRDSSQDHEEQIRKIERYFEATNPEKYKADRHLIMTHARLLMMPPDVLSKYTIVVDEDILLSCLRNTGEVSRKAVEKAANNGGGWKGLYYFLSAEVGKCHVNRFRCKEYFTEELMNQIGICENLNGLLNCSTYYADKDKFSFFLPKYLPKGKYIILSATLDEKIYRAYYQGKGMPIIGYPSYKMRYKGSIRQYTAYSCSRKCLDEKPEIFDGARRIAGEIETLTFNRYLHKVPNKTGLSITNCAGSDLLKGKDICVIGTPYTRPEIYEMIGLHLGETGDMEMKYRNVTYGNYSFRIMAYKEGVLQTLQFYMMSSDLEQSIGRARILRTGATVYLFSNFPCEQAELIDEDYLETLEKARCTGQGASEDVNQSE